MRERRRNELERDKRIEKVNRRQNNRNEEKLRTIKGERRKKNERICE